MNKENGAAAPAIAFNQCMLLFFKLSSYIKREGGVVIKMWVVRGNFMAQLFMLLLVVVL